MHKPCKQTVVVIVCGFEFIGFCSYHYQLLAKKTNQRSAHQYVLAHRHVSGFERTILILTFLPTRELEEAVPEPILCPCPQMSCP